MVKHLIRQAYQSRFIRNVTVLTAGTFVAQLIPLLILPVFTRMYSAELFGIQAILQFGLMLMIPLATGYFDWAIPTPRQETRARGMATIALFLSVIISALTLLIVFFAKDWIITLLQIPEIGNWIYAYPVIVLGASLMSVSNYWLLRLGRYGLQSVNKLVLAVSTAVITLACGLLDVPYGLLIGFVGGIVIDALWAMAIACRTGFSLTRAAPRYFFRMVRKYGHFPMYGSLPTAMSNLASHIPLLVITATYSLAVAGHYAVARNILFGGVSLISVCIGQVVLKHVADLVQRGERAWPDFRRITLWLFLCAFLLMAGVYVIGPWFFTLYLGTDWSASADITRILAFNTFFWLMGPTLSLAVIAVHKIRSVALWQIIYGVMQLGLLLFIHLPFEQFLWRIVAFEVTAYALYTVIMILAMRRFDHEQMAKQAA